MDSTAPYTPISRPQSTDDVTPLLESMPSSVHLSPHRASDGVSSTSESDSFDDIEFQSVPPRPFNMPPRPLNMPPRPFNMPPHFPNMMLHPLNNPLRDDNTKLIHPRLQKAVLTGDVHTISLFERELHLQVTPQKDTVAHIATRFGHTPIFELLSNRCPSLLTKPNFNGDTPLHLAARAGQLSIVNFLLGCDLSREVETEGIGGHQRQQQYLRKKNLSGNTALHEALKNNHEEIARVLATADPHMSYFVKNNKEKSPAYLAAEAGLLQLLEHMLELLDDIHDLRQWKGSTPLHAAIIRGDIESVRLVLRLKPQLVEATDTKGRNPLHYAASIGYFDGIIELFKVDILPAYQADRDGLYPIHMAASSGHIKVIQLLLESCPDSWKLLGQKNRNILHVAARNGKKNVVRYILEVPTFEMLINERDAYGNTPLHLATKHMHSRAISVLARDSRVNLSIMNDDDLTALDIAEKGVTEASFRQFLTLKALRMANAPRSRKLDVFSCGLSLPKSTCLPKEDTVNTVLLVSMFVPIATFIAGFTSPRGLISDGPDQGMTTMMTNANFNAFVISILSVLSIMLSQFRNSITKFTLPLLGISLSMMAVAFTTGLSMVTSRLHWLAKAVLIMTIIFLICILVLLLPHSKKFWSKHRLLQRISYVFYLLSASGGDKDSDSGNDFSDVYARQQPYRASNYGRVR